MQELPQPIPILADAPPQEPYLNPYVHAWFAPRQAYRSFRVHGSPAQALGVMSSAYLAAVLLNPQWLIMATAYGMWVGATLLFFGLVYLSIATLVTWQWYPLAVRKGLRWMGVTGAIDLDDLRYALAVGYVPHLGGLFLGLTSTVLLVLTTGRWLPTLEDVSTMGTWYVSTGVALYVFSIWSCLTLCKTMTEVTGLSPWRNFLALILSGFVIGMVMTAVLIAIGIIVGLGLALIWLAL